MTYCGSKLIHIDPVAAALPTAAPKENTMTNPTALTDGMRDFIAIAVAHLRGDVDAYESLLDVTDPETVLVGAIELVNGLLLLDVAAAKTLPPEVARNFTADQLSAMLVRNAT